MNNTMVTNFCIVMFVWWWMVTEMGCYIIYKGEGDQPCKNINELEPDKAVACKGYFLIEETIKGNVKNVKDLLVNETDAPSMVTFKDRFDSSYGFTALTWAAKKNNTELVKLLVDFDSDVNHLASNNYGALFFLAKHRNNEGVSLLLTKGAEPDIAPKGGYTPLLYAAWNDYFDIVKLLLDNTADPNYMTEGTKYFPLYFASKAGNIEMVNELLKRNAAVDLQTSWNITALMIASAFGNREVVDALLAKDANPNLVDKLGYTALHKAAYYSFEKIIKSLLGKMAEVNAVDFDNNTALHYSAQWGCTDCVKELLKSCPDDKIRNYNNQTALEETRSIVDALKLNPNMSDKEKEIFNRQKSIITIVEGYKSSTC